MFFKKKGLPAESELILCTVKKILPNAVFVNIDDYENLEGMIHISEIAPGRIRNIRDYVIEGKKIVCKVLKINKEKQQIDLSLRRVSISLRKEKNQQTKQEEKAEKILEFLAKKINISLEEIFKKIGNQIIENYGSLSFYFQELINNEELIKEIDPKFQKDLLDIVKERIKPPEVNLNCKLTLISTSSNGIDLIKSAVNDAWKVAKEKKYNIKFQYISAPNYMLKITAEDYKTGEKVLEEMASLVVSNIKKVGGEGNFIKQ